MSELAKNSVIAFTQELVRIPSITPVNAADRPNAIACLGLLADAAKKAGATVTPYTFEGGHETKGYAVDNIYIEWSFGLADHHLCYIGHLDVVPPGNAALWSNDPFSGIIKEGYLYGRGTTDMKGSVAAFFTSINENILELEKTNLRISMIITMDEERAAINGVRKVLQALKERGIKPDAFIVGEPSSQDYLGTHIKIGRRGSLCGTLKATGVQGHAAYQGLFENPNRALSLAISILNSHSFSDGNENFPNTNFESIALKSGDFNATAVIPGMAEVLWNIRYTPSHSPDSLEKWVQSVLDNPPSWAKDHPDYASLKSISVTANKATASLPYCSKIGTLAQAAQKAIKNITGETAQMDGSGGTTDGRFAAAIFPDAEIIEVGVPERGGIIEKTPPIDYKTKGGMHQVDERVALIDLISLQAIFQETVINYAREISSQSSNSNTDIKVSRYG